MSLLSFLFACAPATLDVQTFTSGADGFDTTTHWVDTGAEVVVFDTQFTPALAEQMLAEIEATTDSPITHVVVTHPNPDKFNGATVFQAAGAQLVASQATADAMPGVHDYKEAYFTSVGMFDEGTYPELPTVDVTFSGELELVDGITLVELEHAGVSSTQTVAVVGESLIVGDLVAGRAHAWLEGGIVDGAPQPDIDAWIAALDELPALGSTVYPGRGQVLPVNAAVVEQQEYLRTVDGLVSEYVAENPELDGDDWTAITELAVQAYPDHELSYLVTYGVYGLALQRAAE